MLGEAIERIEGLLVLAAFVSMIARKIRLPYTVGLTLAGLLAALLPHADSIRLTRGLIFDVFLPPLIFEAALQMEWKRFRRDLPVTLTLATLGVLISAGVVGVGAYYLLHWSWQASTIFAILISATDPVAVIATFRDLKVGGRVQMLVESESLLNDGTSAVLFSIAAAALSGDSVTAPGALGSFFLTIGGGIIVGALVGGIALLLAGRTSDHLVELTFTTAAAYSSFLIAERFHVSGVLATMTAGIVLRNVGVLGALSDAGRQAVEQFWEYAGFVANSLIFLLIGMSLAHQPWSSFWVVCAVMTVLVIAARAAAVYGCSALFVRSSHRVSPAHQHVLFWGGLRGALALALALGLPETFTSKSQILTVTFAVVAFSVVFQGTTMIPLLSRLGICGEES